MIQLSSFSHAASKKKLISYNLSAVRFDYGANGEMKSRLKPVYFENQKQCAAALGLDEYELKQWKAENCPAFRYGRIYHAELLEWLKNHKPHARRTPLVRGSIR